jgi:hypothetical protein
MSPEPFRGCALRGIHEYKSRVAEHRQDVAIGVATFTRTRLSKSGRWHGLGNAVIGTSRVKGLSWDIAAPSFGDVDGSCGFASGADREALSALLVHTLQMGDAV